MHEAGSPESAAGRLRELLAVWPANALGHYELALAMVAQQYAKAGRKAPTRARLSIHSELSPSRAALDAYAKARIHDPLMIRAYQGGEVKGGDVFMVLGKTVRPLWEALTRASEAKVDDPHLQRVQLRAGFRAPPGSVPAGNSRFQDREQLFIPQGSRGLDSASFRAL